MPQDFHNAASQGSCQPSAPFDATVQFAFLVESGADAAMSLVSRAVAAATRTATSAALDTESQERVKDAIREHPRHAGLIPPVDAGDPSATPTPTPGGAQPQDTPKKKEGDEKKKDGEAGSNPKSGKKGPLALGTAAVKGDGSSKRRGKLSKRNSEAGDETMHATDDAADEDY